MQVFPDNNYQLQYINTMIIVIQFLRITIINYSTLDVITLTIIMQVFPDNNYQLQYIYIYTMIIVIQFFRITIINYSTLDYGYIKSDIGKL